MNLARRAVTILCESRLIRRWAGGLINPQRRFDNTRDRIVSHGSRKTEIESNGGTPAMAHHVRKCFSMSALRFPIVAIGCGALLVCGGCAWLPGYTPDVHPKRVERH